MMGTKGKSIQNSAFIVSVKYLQCTNRENNNKHENEYIYCTFIILRGQMYKLQEGLNENNRHNVQTLIPGVLRTFASSELKVKLLSAVNATYTMYHGDRSSPEVDAKLPFVHTFSDAGTFVVRLKATYNNSVITKTSRVVKVSVTLY